MSVAADGGEDVDGEVAADVVGGLVEVVDGDFNSVSKVVDVGFMELAVRIVVRGVTRLLGIGERFTEVSDGDRKPAAEAGATEPVPGRAMICGAVGLLPGPTLLIRR